MLVRAIALTALWVGSTATATHAADLRLAPNLAERFAASERIDVVVALRPPTASRSAASRSRWRAQIAHRQASVIARAHAQAQPADLIVQQQFGVVNGFTASVSRAGLAALTAQADVLRIDPAEEGSAALAHSVPQIDADTVHALGLDGRGVTVAVLDTAIDTAHPDLAGHIAAEECFCSTACCPGNVTRLSGPGSATGTGAIHGTHVTGIIVSQGNHQIASIGVAPGAQVVAIRVLDDSARGSLADWVAALDWLAMNRPDVRAVNMSLVTDALFPPNCDAGSAFNMLFKEAIDTLRAQGTLVFAAAGNNGNYAQMAAPACVSSAVAVGAVDRNDAVATFSNSATTLAVLAPGVKIQSTAPFASTAVLSGTSMATPHAVGVAALLWNAEPELSPDQVETFMRTTGVPILDARNGLTFPRIDALTAYGAAQFAGELVRGGGSRLSDCLVEWQVTPRASVQTRARVVALCHDGDPACDHDNVAGQCTFEVSLCFNVPDGRIPYCRTNDPIRRVTLFTPQLDAPNSVDAGNAAATLEVLPPTPITGERVCTANIPITVPTGAHGRGDRTLHVTAETIDRRDADRGRFVCLSP